ncbi:MAG: DUF4861 domain-containing protein [Bacteroidales bacterium]|nr:DUF4861 domain-containing protein [Bacteroidales bacterium]
MKKIISLFIILVTIQYFSYSKNFTRIYVKVENQWNSPKIDEPIIINLANLNLDFEIKSAVVKENNNIEIPSQLDDLNYDHINDELAFLINIEKLSSKEYTIDLSDTEQQNNYITRVHAQMLVSDKKGKHVPVVSVTIPGTSNIYSQMHHHGPAFESELVAYRLYFDEKQTVDIYGKFNKGFEIKESGWYPNDEQLAKGFGDDVLRVGGSCGIGALKGWDGSKTIHITPVKTRTASIIAYGPVRAIVEMKVIEWNYQGDLLNMTNRYTIYGGHRDAIVETFFNKPIKNQVFATGVQKIKKSESFYNKKGLVACWGTDWPVNDTIKYAKETVGLATYIPQKYNPDKVEDKHNYLYTISPKNLDYFKYYITFTSKKETFGYATKEDWFNFLPTWKENLDHPVNITITK